MRAGEEIDSKDSLLKEPIRRLGGSDHVPEILRIESIAFGGQGVARSASGKVLFVRGGLPGDLVEARVFKGRRRHAEARLLKVVEASPERLEARCRHQAVCGGCPLQTLDYAAQLREKETIVREAWRRIGGLAPERVDPILPAPALFHYRNKMEFSFSDQQWLELAEDEAPRVTDFGLGQHVPGVYSKVFDLLECHLGSDLMAPILDLTRQFVREEGGGREDVWHVHGQHGFWRFVVIRESRIPGQRMVNLITTSGGDDRVERLSALLLKRFPGQISSIVNTVQAGSGQVATGRLDRILHGDGLLRETLGGLDFELAPQAFFQTNTQQAERLFGLVRENLDPAGTGTLLDLYCGSGAIALLMAGLADKVVGVELVPEAVAAAQRNARLNGLEHKVDFLCGDVLHLLKDGVLPRPDTVIVDPPRAGLHPKVVQHLLQLAARRLIYVSCNPATQARDAALLAEGGYRPLRLSPVDMFPHTYHVEAVALFGRD